MGAIGGLIGWFLQENLINYSGHVVRLPDGTLEPGALTSVEVMRLVVSVGGSIGLFLGIVDGIVEGNTRKLVRGMIVGSLSGIVLGFVGMTIGGIAYNKLGGGNHLTGPSMFSFAQQVIARTFGWALVGLGVGIGSAIQTGVPKRIANGAIGGFIGGFLGGFIFDLLANATNPVMAIGGSGPHDVGGPSRFVGFTAIGAFAGLLVGVMDELRKQAWVRILAGKNEGKDVLLSRPVNILGRDERCDVPLFGDASVGVQHAAIRASGNRFNLMDAGTPGGTLVNGQRIPPGNDLLLRDGDMIQIGAHRILFRERATAGAGNRTAIDEPRSKSPLSATPVPAHLCPYCGGQKDAAGNCLCTIGGASASPSYGAPGQSVPTTNLQNAPLPAQMAYGAPVGMPGATMAPVMPVAPAMSGAPMGRLVGLDGIAAGQVFTLAGPNITVGREPEREIPLTSDVTVSRFHARLANENGVWTVYDNGSSNGTFVNGIRVSTQPLMRGDTVQFGSSKFRFE
jgi:pSer/pThr/pTyr-binding forkhead associated (FHA) protein